VELASARLEQTRQRQLVRTGLAPVASMNSFDAAAKALEQRVRTASGREQDLKLDAEKLYLTWKDAEDSYARATSDYDTAVWID
jgi:hypothetical protein